VTKKSLKARLGDAIETGLVESGREFTRDGNVFTIAEGAPANAAATLQAMAEEDGGTITMSIDGGPQMEIPVDLPRANRPADDRLRLLIERVERLEEEKKDISDDIKDVYAEAKATGYDAKIMKQIVKLRKMKPDDRREMEAVLDTYKSALGID
jgi:uncharacterized protein (UPF0335 family)